MRDLMRLRAPIAEDIFLHSSLMWLDHESRSSIIKPNDLACSTLQIGWPSNWILISLRLRSKFRSPVMTISISFALDVSCFVIHIRWAIAGTKNKILSFWRCYFHPKALKIRLIILKLLNKLVIEVRGNVNENNTFSAGFISPYKWVAVNWSWTSLSLIDESSRVSFKDRTCGRWVSQKYNLEHITESISGFSWFFKPHLDLKQNGTSLLSVKSILCHDQFDNFNIPRATHGHLTVVRFRGSGEFKPCLAGVGNLNRKCRNNTAGWSTAEQNCLQACLVHSMSWRLMFLASTPLLKCQWTRKDCRILHSSFVMKEIYC